MARVVACTALSALVGVGATALGLLDGTLWGAAAVFSAAGMLSGLVLYGQASNRTPPSA